MTNQLSRLIGALAVVSGSLSTASLAAQAPPHPMADRPVVEVVGLRHWTVEMIQDSLDRYSPGDSLHSHGCAAALRYKLGFADAAVTRLSFPGQPERIIVAVREPQDSALVRYRDLPLDSADARLDWRQASSLMAGNPRAFFTAVQAYTNTSEMSPPRYRSAEDSVAAAVLLTFLRGRTSEEDRLAATEALAHSANVYDRTTAALILANFPQRDDTYWTLVDAMRESDGPVKSVAGQVLRVLTDRAPRTVDWTPVTATIHAMMNGTSLFELPTLLHVLASTGVGPRQAEGFLRGGGDMLMAYLGSETRMLARPAHALLVQLRGADLGADPEVWRAWIASL